MTIRPFIVPDASQIAQLFHDTVRYVNIRDYSESQVQAWAPDNIHFRDWQKVCSEKHTFIAEENGKITGFAELDKDGHIDCFYCHKNYQRKGIGQLLFQSLEKKAQNLGLKKLYAEVSITAKPFFHKIGFVEVRKQHVYTRGETFVNNGEKTGTGWLTMISFYPNQNAYRSYRVLSGFLVTDHPSVQTHVTFVWITDSVAINAHSIDQH